MELPEIRPQPPFRESYKRRRDFPLFGKDLYTPPRALEPEDLDDPNSIPVNYYFRENQVNVPEIKRMFESLVFLRLGKGKNRAGESGFLVQQGGLVATCAHAFMNFELGEKLVSGQLLYRDRKISLEDARIIFEPKFFRDLDLALIKVPELSGFPLVSISEYSGPLKRGDLVFALGYPITYRSRFPVLSCGVVLEHDITSHTIKHNCQVHPGNSGGPLIDRAGKLVGMVKGEPGVPGLHIINEFTDLAWAVDSAKIKEVMVTV